MLTMSINGSIYFWREGMPQGLTEKHPGRAEATNGEVPGRIEAMECKFKMIPIKELIIIYPGPPSNELNAV